LAAEVGFQPTPPLEANLQNGLRQSCLDDSGRGEGTVASAVPKSDYSPTPLPLLIYYYVIIEAEVGIDPEKLDFWTENSRIPVPVNDYSPLSRHYPSTIFSPYFVSHFVSHL